MSTVTSVKIGKTPTYLFRKGSIYYFRIAIPIDVRKVFGRTEINYSLQTQDLLQARMKANILSISIQNLIKKIRRGDLTMADINVEEFRKQVSDLYSNWFKGIEESRPLGKKPFTEKELEKRISEIETVLKNMRKDIASYDHKSTSGLVELVLKRMGVTEPNKVEQFDHLCREIKIDYMKLQEVYLDHAKGIYSINYPWEENGNSVSAITVTEEPSILLSEALAFYIEEASHNWSLKTQEENSTMIQNFIDIVGDCPLNYLTREKVRDFKVKLVRFPKNVTKNPKYRDKTIQQIIEMEVPENERLSVTTIKNRFSKIGSFLTWCRRQGYSVDEVFTDILTMASSKRADQFRAILTPEDLNLIFHSKEYLEDKFERPSRFWVPILGLYTGARIEEICQLDLEDIIQSEGVWCLDINASGNKSIKTSAGQRLVPLHPFIVEELKFIDYVSMMKREGHERPFPTLKKTENQGYSHELSKWYGRYRKKIGISDTDQGKKSFHSFRHTFLTNCKYNDVDKDKAAEVVGHESGHNDMTYGRYGKKYTPDILYKDVICKLDFGVDLGHLKKSKFVVSNADEEE